MSFTPHSSLPNHYLLLQNPGMFDAVDLDPYGSPAQLLDSAVQVGGPSASALAMPLAAPPPALDLYTPKSVSRH